MILNRVRLPSNEDRLANAVALNVANKAINAPNTNAQGTKYANTTGCQMRRRCIKATDNSPTKLDAVVASKIGKNTKVGSAAPCWARYIKIVTGNKVNEDAFKTRNKICALLAVVLEGLISCSARMAFKPMGVAALSKPKPFAAKFRVIKPKAGCPRGTSGINLANKGPNSF